MNLDVMSWKALDQFIEDHQLEFIMTMMEIDVALAALSTTLSIIIKYQ